MSRSIAVPALAAALICCTSCLVESAQPLYTADEDKVCAPLLGDWLTTDGEGTRLVFDSVPGDGDSYMHLTVTTADGKASYFECRTAQLGWESWLDLQQTDDFGAPADPATPHWFMRARLGLGTRWELQLPDAQKLYDHLEAHPGTLQFEGSLGEGELSMLKLRGPTAELRAFFGSEAADAVLGDAIVIEPRRPGPAPASS